MSLNLFDVPEVDYRYEASRDVVFQPALTGIQPITFYIPASDDCYDPNELRFQVKVTRVLKHFLCSSRLASTFGKSLSAVFVASLISA